MLKPSYISLFILFLLCACNRPYDDLLEKQNPNEFTYYGTPPKNVILVIGDGMGMSHVTAGLYTSKKPFILQRFPTTGLQTCHSSDDLTTDSAAGATSFASGVKTANGMVGMDSKKKPVKTILEEAEQKDIPTGLVVTSTIVHATPAAFYAHVPDRLMYEEIADASVIADVDLMVGGGIKYYTERKDSRDLLKELNTRGYQVSKNKAGNDIDWNSEKNIMWLTAYDDPPRASEGRNYLAPATRKAIQFLDKRSDKGFFLMIEGSQIDWGGHANLNDYIISEMRDFNKMLREVYEFAREDEETLVVVTSDHECGGYALNSDSTPDNINGQFTSDYHTAAMVPVFAMGPGHAHFTGIIDNTDIYHKIKSLWSIFQE